MTENNFMPPDSRARAGTASHRRIEPKGVLQKNLKTIRVSWARHCWSLSRRSSARPARRRQRASSGEGSAAAADASGQHRQQRAGSEEPTSRPNATRSNSRRLWPATAEIPRSQLRRPRSRPPPRPMGRRACSACIPGQTCPQAGYPASRRSTAQLSPEQQQEQQTRRERPRAGRQRPLRVQSCLCSSLPIQPQQDKHCQQAGQQPQSQRCRQNSAA